MVTQKPKTHARKNQNEEESVINSSRNQNITFGTNYFQWLFIHFGEDLNHLQPLGGWKERKKQKKIYVPLASTTTVLLAC